MLHRSPATQNAPCRRRASSGPFKTPTGGLEIIRGDNGAFDLRSLATDVSNIGEYLEFIISFESDLKIGQGEHMVLPTIVQEQNDQGTDHLLDLYRKAPREVMQVWYGRSDAIANAVNWVALCWRLLPCRRVAVPLPISKSGFMRIQCAAPSMALRSCCPLGCWPNGSKS